MSQQIRRLIALLMAFGVVAAACGSDEPTDATQADSTESADSEGTDAESDAEEASGDTDEEPTEGEGSEAAASESLLEGAIPCEQQHAGKTVTIFSPVRDSDTDTPVADFVAAYQPLMDCTGVEIVWEGTDQFETELNIRLEGGNPPDVIDYPQPGLLANHARAGFLQVLPDDLAERVENDFIAGWDTYGTVDGTIYGVPGRSGVKSLVWYSPSAFADAGYEVPGTLEELTTLSDQIVADGQVPWCVGAESGVATGWVLTDWMEDFMLRIHGEDVYDQWITNEMAFNDPRVVEVADAVGAFIKNPDYLGGENLVRAIATTKFQDSGLGIADRSCYLHRQASFYANLFPEGTTTGPDGDINFFYLPSREGDPRYILGGGDLYTAGTDKPESYDVLRYTGSVDYQQQLLNVRGELSPLLEIDLDQIDDPFVKQLSELQASADVFRFDASDLMPGSVGAGTFWTEVTAWVAGGDTQTFVDNVQESWPTDG